MEIAFLSVQNVLEEFSSANADALTSLIKDELVRQCGLSLKNQKGLATDGAAVIIDTNNGAAAELKELNPVIINFHCICHKLALACTDRRLSFIPFKLWMKVAVLQLMACSTD